MTENKTDVIVVGGGPGGLSCAVTIARKGKKVVLIERGSYAGSKNVFGGAIYANPTKQIFPDFENSAPLERKNVENNFVLLGENDSTSVSYRNKSSDAVSYTVIRAKFDRWMADEAKKEGAIVVEETVVRELLVKDGRVTGVKTELEEYYSDIVVLADGANSLLARQIGLRNDFEPSDMALSVKEVFKIDKEKINERFHVSDNEGAIYELFGGPLLGTLGLGFMYTNSNSVTIGLGVTMDDLVAKSLRPYDLIDKLKQHPVIAPFIKDGELLEYSAHLIPEGGYPKIPKLSGAGVMVAGDAAMLVNNLHWEGTNLAMISGKIAGETAVTALAREDFSEKMLSKYDEELSKSFVIQDLKTYRDLMPIIHSRCESFLGYYPRKINEFFEMFTSTDCEPKRKKYWKYIKSFFAERKIFELFKDGWNVTKLIWSILIK